jgi:hypothetical protein
MRVERQIRHLPPQRQAETIERILEEGVASEQATGRALRRAREKQERKKSSGRGFRVGGVVRQRQG